MFEVLCFNINAVRHATTEAQKVAKDSEEKPTETSSKTRFLNLEMYTLINQAKCFFFQDRPCKYATAP